jgi:hypothetical protein
MIFNCNGQIICDGSLKAFIEIIGAGISTKLEYEITPLCIETKTVNDPSLSDKKCWRFSGRGIKNTDEPNLSYEFFACGSTAEYRTAAANPNGVNLFVDGINVAGAGYYYLRSTARLEIVENAIYAGDVNSQGNCDNCQSATEVLIKSRTNTLLKKNFRNPVVVKHTCGKCPPGHTECQHKGYPGYCCVPCADIARKLDNIARGK